MLRDWLLGAASTLIGEDGEFNDWSEYVNTVIEEDLRERGLIDG